jgi:hypothetical protein
MECVKELIIYSIVFDTNYSIVFHTSFSRIDAVETIIGGNASKKRGSIVIERKLVEYCRCSTDSFGFLAIQLRKMFHCTQIHFSFEKNWNEF